jgi:hypothetical protein
MSQEAVTIPAQLQLYINRCLDDKERHSLPVVFEGKVVSLRKLFDFERKCFKIYHGKTPSFSMIQPLSLSIPVNLQDPVRVAELVMWFKDVRSHNRPSGPLLTTSQSVTKRQAAV